MPDSPFSTEFRPPRNLRVYAFDPATGRKFANRTTREVTITLPADMEPPNEGRSMVGPSGRYFEVIDYDPSSRVFYKPIDLNDPEVWLGGGLPASPEDPQFHQQMVYAVAMNTVAVFEHALGRPMLWAPKTKKSRGLWVDEYVPQLRIYPHALREANAYYDPAKKALLFGYFRAAADSTGAPPGTMVFTCLSHDVIVHETVHALLDGLHPRYAENANPDMRALHEAFADIVALFQLFSFPEVLEDQISKTHGDLKRQSLLGQLAQEFGQSIGRGHALRDFLGHVGEDGEWTLRPATPDALRRAKGPHARGAVLVAAVFRAFLTIYETRVSDLFRIASHGSGVLRQGDLDPDLKKRLAAEAAQCARRVLRICIRAMDYTPPVNVDMGDYLRAILTADHDLFPKDEQGYRDAFIEAFTAWGILPEGMPIISETTLLWPTATEAERARQATPKPAKGDGTPKDEAQPEDGDKSSWLNKLQGDLGLMLSKPRRMLSYLNDENNKPEAAQPKTYNALLDQAGKDASEVAFLIRNRMHDLTKLGDTLKDRSKPNRNVLKLDVNLLEVDAIRDREVFFYASNHYKRLLWLLINTKKTKRFGELTGLCFDNTIPPTVMRSQTMGSPSLHVAAVRIAKRIGARGQHEREYVIEIIQTRRGYLSFDQQLEEDHREVQPANNKRPYDFLYRAGTTFLIDARSFAIRRLIRSRYDISSPKGLEAHRRHLAGEGTRPRNAFHAASSAGSDHAFTELHLHDPFEDREGVS